MKKNSDNRGFSLVELVIVIAIMAILVGVLAPAYLSYLDRSRKGMDVDTVDTVVKAMNALAYDNNFVMVNGQTMEATLTTNQELGFVATNGVDDMNDKLKEAFYRIITPEAKLKYQHWGDKVTITAKVNGDGELEMTCDNIKFKQYATAISFES